jgi:predicted HTH domain antitoxin
MRLGERVSLVLPERLKKEIESLARSAGIDRSSIMRTLLSRGLTEEKLDLAVDSYMKGKTSLGKSAEAAGVSMYRFLDELRNRRTGLRYRVEDAERELREILKEHE